MRGYLTVTGLHPSGTGTATFKIPSSAVEHFQRHGPGHKFFDALLIADVVKAPAAIFKGLKREEQEGGICYAGIPPRRYQDHHITVPPRPGMTFAVFMNANKVIFEWRWEKADPGKPEYPINSSERFEKVLWSR
ncbi:MAG: hypothetical protein M3463_09145 [Verrucomicrobiota bacterium]|nr:hypothetical protein [Verrucomicrobiota bacterium]